MQSPQRGDETKKLLQTDKVPSDKQLIIRNAFPLEPYDIQMQIGLKIHSALNKQKTKFMIIESPTGTGKSYSLLVPILVWLSQNKYKTKVKKQNQNEKNQHKKIPSFLLKRNTEGQSLENKQKTMKKQRQIKQNSIIDIEEIVSSQKIKLKNLPQNTQISGLSKIFDELDVDEIQNQKKIGQKSSKRQISKQQRFVERQINLQRQDIPVKLIFVSRTHSQLEQIVKSTEQIKLKIKHQLNQQLFALSLGSKELLCCNPQFKKLSTSQNQSISQKCQYLLNHSSCSYSHSHLIKQFLGKSIDEAKKISQNHKICGYYGLKNLIDIADVLFVPYSSLVNSQIRAKIGININNSIIVFDEGHNLMDFIKNSSSTEIFYFEVQSFIQKIKAYLQKYGQKMKVQNKYTLQHFIYVLQSLLDCMNRYFSEKLKNQKQNYLSVSVLDLIVELNIKDLRLYKIQNLFYLLDYDKKVTFFEPQPKLKTKNKQNDLRNISIGQVHKIIDWIGMLYKHSEQKIVVLIKKNQQNSEKIVNNMSFKLLCLYSQELQKIIHSSRMTICAGGTMQPLSDFQQILKKSNFNHQIVKVGHIIHPSQCKIFCVNKYEGKQIKFNHQNLNSQKEVKFLQKMITKTLKVIESSTPIQQGIIIFIQSYKLLSLLKQCLAKQELFSTILFDSQKSENQNIFKNHSERISKNQRSILISVMGGKLSQGINFSDNLARKLIVFGLPYPNIMSPQIVQQMKYYDQLKIQNFNGQIYYESLCLKAINQTIGRAIRHKNDWAEIHLIDSRFQNVKNKFSQWMRKSIKIVNDLQHLGQESKIK